MSTPTPWSSLPSDRIKPRNTPSQSQSQKTPKQKQKQKQKQQAGAQPNPKSRQLLALESLLHAVQSTGVNAVPDPKGGCFCQAREHPPSPYTPACLTCGLPLCLLNPPHRACPHCHHAPAPRLMESTLVRLKQEIGEMERREEEARERARREVGAFPALGGGSGRATPTMITAPVPSQHKVLSVNSKTKKVTVSSYSNTPTPAASRPQTPEPLRVPPPPAEVVYAKRKVDPGRPYVNFGGGAARYVSPDKGKGRGRGGEVGAS